MSETKTVETPTAPAHGHEVDFNKYVRLCISVFAVVIVATSLMVWISFLPGYGWSAKVGMILAVASTNAFFVAGFLMHLLSEKKLIYTVLMFTVIFVIGLFVLTICAMHDMPSGTQLH